jgi:hypothetical protein
MDNPERSSSTASPRRGFGASETFVGQRRFQILGRKGLIRLPASAQSPVMRSRPRRLKLALTMHFVIPNRRILPVRNLLLAGQHPVPRAIKLHLGMTNFSNWALRIGSRGV